MTGNMPIKELSDTSSALSLVHAPMARGSFPVSLLSDRFNQVIDLSCEIDCGIEPPSSFFAVIDGEQRRKCNDENAVRKCEGCFTGVWSRGGMPAAPILTYINSAPQERGAARKPMAATRPRASCFRD